MLECMQNRKMQTLIVAFVAHTFGENLLITSGPTLNNR